MIPCLIPVRWGSKGLPYKNIRKIQGRTLIEHATRAVFNAKTSVTPWVACENNQILEHAKYLGAKSYRRSLESSADDASTDLIISEWLEYLTSINALPKSFILLQVTNPSTTADWIDGAIRYFNESQNLDKTISCVFTAVPFHGFIWREDKNDFVGVNHSSSSPRARRQDLEHEDYLENGGVYVIDTKKFLETGSRFGKRPRPFLVEDRLPEIDSLPDLERHILSRSNDKFSVQIGYKCRSIKLFEKGIIFLDFDDISASGLRSSGDLASTFFLQSRHDSLGLKNLQEEGYLVVLVSTEPEDCSSHERIKELGVGHIFNRTSLDDVVSYCERHDRLLTESIYVGHTSSSLEIMSLVGISICASDAHETVKSRADIVFNTNFAANFLYQFFDSVNKKFYET